MSLRTLLKELGRHSRVSEYVVNESRSQRFVRGTQAGGGGLSVRHRLDVEIFVDAQGGRGRTLLTIAADTASAVRAQLDDATTRASNNLGPTWAMPPPTAPARVNVADDELVAEPRAALEQLAGRLVKHGEWVREHELYAVVEETRCITSAGFDNSFRAGLVGARVVVGSERRRQIDVVARRIADLGLGKRIADSRSAGAAPVVGAIPPGAYDLVVTGGGFGVAPRESVFCSLVELADARRYRNGIGRVRLGERVAGHSFALRSDGARDFGLFSKPFDVQGFGTRRFAIVEGGLLSGLALTAMDAALLGSEPNGGIDNLVVECETASDAVVRAPIDRNVLIVDELAWVRSDELTGAVQLAVRRGRLLARDGRETPVAGGVVGAPSELLFSSPLGTERRLELPWLLAPAVLRLGRVAVI